MGMLWVVLLFFGVEAVGSNEPHPLDSEAFLFCHEEGWSEQMLVKWCPLLENAPEERCRGMRAICEQLSLSLIHISEPTRPY